MHYFLTICLIIFFGSESIFAKTKPSAIKPQNILIVISFNKLRTERKEAVQPSKNYSLAGGGGGWGCSHCDVSSQGNYSLMISEVKRLRNGLSIHLNVSISSRDGKEASIDKEFFVPNKFYFEEYFANGLKIKISMVQSN